jgi:hypothetical protein
VKQPIALALMMTGLLLGGPARAGDLLTTGDTFPALQAVDQHGEAYVFEPGTNAVLIAFEMGAARAANRLLAEQSPEYLDDHQAVYVANIYGMPGIGRRFALPKMRKYPHRIVLADEENLLTPFPHRKGLITVLELDDAAVIRSVSFWNPTEEPLSLP